MSKEPTKIGISQQEKIAPTVNKQTPRRLPFSTYPTPSIQTRNRRSPSRMPCLPVQHFQQLLGELWSGEFSAQNWPLRRAVDKLKNGHPTGAVEMVLNHFEITCCGMHRPNRVVFFVSRSSSTISSAQPVLRKLILCSATRFQPFPALC
jgi:hypothetical protein